MACKHTLKATPVDGQAHGNTYDVLSVTGLIATHTPEEDEGESC